MTRPAAAARGYSPIDDVFSQKREMMVRLIEFDEEWLGPWIVAYPRPRRRR